MGSRPYDTPGVYIEEVPSGARPIQAVGTRTAGFIGVAPIAGRFLDEAKPVNNWAEFYKYYMSRSDAEAGQIEQARQDLKQARDHLRQVTGGGKVEETLTEKDAKVHQAWQDYKAAQAKRAQLKPDTQETVKKQTEARVEATEERFIQALQARVDRIQEEANSQAEAAQALLALKAAQDELEGLKEAPEARKQDVLNKVESLEQEVIKKIEASMAETEREKAIEDAKARVKKAEEALQAAEENATHLSDAVYGFFLNGGSRCYIVNIGPDDSKIEAGLRLLEEVDEIAIVAAPGYTTYNAYDAIRSHCDRLRDRVGILDGPEVLDEKVMMQLRGEVVKDSPWEMPPYSETGQLTLYVPWIKVSNPNAKATNGSASNGKEADKKKTVPPSGHIAGVWARTDVERGVHKAPANEPVRGALGLTKQITHDEQGGLNKVGVNVIRYFPNGGYLVWGARTLTLEPAFKYLNVRRLFNMIEESIQESTRWIVFEPNDRPLWQAIRRDVTAFLMGFWRDGALMGPTPQDAFYVKCDEETNPTDSINDGKVVIEVGLAPVRPAEFVIFRISQYEAGTEIEAQRD